MLDRTMRNGTSALFLLHSISPQLLITGTRLYSTWSHPEQSESFLSSRRTVFFSFPEGKVPFPLLYPSELDFFILLRKRNQLPKKRLPGTSINNKKKKSRPLKGKTTKSLLCACVCVGPFCPTGRDKFVGSGQILSSLTGTPRPERYICVGISVTDDEPFLDFFFLLTDASFLRIDFFSPFFNQLLDNDRRNNRCLLWGWWWCMCRYIQKFPRVRSHPSKQLEK